MATEKLLSVVGAAKVSIGVGFRTNDDGAIEGFTLKVWASAVKPGTQIVRTVGDRVTEVGRVYEMSENGVEPES